MMSSRRSNSILLAVAFIIIVGMVARMPEEEIARYIVWGVN